MAEVDKVVPEHKHLIIRAEVNSPPKEAEWVKDWLGHLVEKIGMTICDGPHASYVDVPGNCGVTGVVIIETSHIAIHVWDEPNPALIQLDVYTCGPFNKQDIFDELQQFEPSKVEWKFLDREHGLKELEIQDAN
jgi:S-adenosylmethionine/arginine decarboxylase-like enzyme